MLDDQMKTITELVMSNIESVATLREKMEQVDATATAAASAATAAATATPPPLNTAASTPAGLGDEGPERREEGRTEFGMKLRMTERKTFSKVPEYSGDASQFDVWLYKARGFLHQEADYRP